MDDNRPSFISINDTVEVQTNVEVGRLLPEAGTPLIEMVDGIDEDRDGEESIVLPTDDTANAAPPFEWDGDDLRVIHNTSPRSDDDLRVIHASPRSYSRSRRAVNNKSSSSHSKGGPTSATSFVGKNISSSPSLTSSMPSTIPINGVPDSGSELPHLHIS